MKFLLRLVNKETERERQRQRQRQRETERDRERQRDVPLCIFITNVYVDVCCFYVSPMYQYCIH